MNKNSNFKPWHRTLLPRACISFQQCQQHLGAGWKLDNRASPQIHCVWIFNLTKSPGNLFAQAPILWPPDAKTWLSGKDTDAEKDWGQEEKRVTEDKIVRWLHQLDGHEFEQTLEDSKGREAWHVAVHGVAKSRTQLSDWITATCEKDYFRESRNLSKVHQRVNTGHTKEKGNWIY